MRALSAAAALALGGCAGGPVFVDQVEAGQAVLIDASGRVEVVPASALPPDAGEGDWLGGPPDAAARLADLRRRLGAADDGRDLRLP